MQCLKFPKKCCWRFKCSGTWHCVTGLVVPDHSTDLQPVKMEAPPSFGTSTTTHPTKQCQIPENMNIHLIESLPQVNHNWISAYFRPFTMSFTSFCEKTYVPEGPTHGNWTSHVHYVLSNQMGHLSRNGNKNANILHAFSMKTGRGSHALQHDKWCVYVTLLQCWPLNLGGAFSQTSKSVKKCLISHCVYYSRILMNIIIYTYIMDQCSN
jgi:hypothetical protein